MSEAFESQPLPPYRQPVADVVARLDTDLDRGLSRSEARARLEKYGRNELAAEKPVPAWRRFLAQFKDALVLLLLAATAISAGLWLFQRDSSLPHEAIAIFGNVEEYEAAKRGDPVPRFRARLVTDETLSAEEADAIGEAARQEMDEAVEFGLASPFPAPEKAVEHVYA